MSTYWGGGLKPPGLTSKSDSFDQVTEIITNDQPQLLPAKLGTPMNEQHLVHPCIHEAMYASLSRWMGDAVGPLISTKIFSWDKAGTASTRVEYSDFAEQFELKPGDKFEKMLDDVCMLHRLSELKTRTADSKIKEKEYSVSSKLAKLISDADLKFEAKLAEIETQCALFRTPTESVDGDGADAPASEPSVEFRDALLEVNASVHLLEALLSGLNERAETARRVHLEEMDKASIDLQGALEASVATINCEA